MKVAFFSPNNPSPASSGFHQRELEILSGLRYLGCSTHLLSSIFKSIHPWTASSIKHLKLNLVETLQIYQPTRWDYLIWQLSKYHRVIPQYFPTLSAILTPPGFRAWFKRRIEDITPDIIWMNYAYYDGLVDHIDFKNIVRAIDIIDLISVNRKMWRAISPLHKPSTCLSAENIDDQLLEEDFFIKSNFPVEAWEYKLYEKYSYTVSINQIETDTLKRNTQCTHVIYIPMSIELPKAVAEYSGPAIFPTGDNPYNIQGYFYFTKKVLPLILKESSEFILQVTGYCSMDRVSPVDGVLLSGYVPDLTISFSTARFLICPIFGGTGQLIKVIEAMSYGLPVIIPSQAASRTPVRHNYNGFIARDVNEFADFTLRLWNDRELCLRMGQAARATVAEEYSKSHLYSGLNQILRSV